MRSHTPRTLVLPLLLAVAVGAGSRPQAAVAAIYNVGLGGAAAGCEASTLEAAVALAGATAANDEIRLVSGVGFQPAGTVLLDNWSASSHGTLVVRGGYSSCTDTTADGPRAQVDFMLADPGIRIRTAAAGRAVVTFERVSLFNSPGRALEVEWNSTVELHDVELVFNDGGGLTAHVGGAEVYLDAATEIHHNDVLGNGGGIHCFNSGVTVESEAWVHDNSATEGGGGLYAGGCEVILGADAILASNHADVDGGGIFADLGALVSLFQGAVVAGNIAGGWGGGIAADGAATQVLLIGAEVRQNLSDTGGAGLQAANGAFVGASGISCGSGFCPTLIRQNGLAAGARNGSAAAAIDGGVVQLKQTRVLANVVPEAEGFGSVFYASTDGELRTESVEIWGNTGANRVFQVASGGSVRAAFTTAARNRYLDAGGQPVEAYALWATGTGSEARLYSSIFHPTAGYFADASVSGEIDCLITQSTLGLPAWSGEVYIVDPGYANLVAGNLSVKHTSPAVDFCDSTRYAPTGGALDGRARSHDIPANPQAQPGPLGGLSIQDVGAYEVWEIFANGFASGSTGAWSSVAP